MSKVASWGTSIGSALAAAIDNEWRLREAPAGYIRWALNNGFASRSGGTYRCSGDGLFRHVLGMRVGSKRKIRERDKVEYRRLDMTMDIKKHF